MPDKRIIVIGAIDPVYEHDCAYVSLEIRFPAFPEKPLGPMNIVTLRLVVPATRDSSLQSVQEAAMAKARDLLKLEGFPEDWKVIHGGAQTLGVAEYSGMGGRIGQEYAGIE